MATTWCARAEESAGCPFLCQARRLKQVLIVEPGCIRLCAAVSCTTSFSHRRHHSVPYGTFEVDALCYRTRECHTTGSRSKTI
jgi:hypothetical protein